MGNSKAASGAELRNGVGISGREVLLWMLLGAAMLLIAFAENRGTIWTNDGFQYMSIAENIRSGHGISTSLIHFDAEYSEKKLPAPMTSQPPGYPVAIAFLSLTGMSMEHAAVLISALAFILLIPLLAMYANKMEITALGIRFVLAILITNQYTAQLSVAIVSEELFVLVTMASLFILLVSEGTGAQWRWRTIALPLAGLLVGLSYWVRYVGLYLIIYVIGLYGFRLLRHRNRKSMQDLASVSISAPIAAVGMLRNSLLMGSWKGGNEQHAAHSLTAMLEGVCISSLRLLFGTGLHVFYLRLLQMSGAIVLCVILIGAVVLFTYLPSRRVARSRGVALLAGFAIFYMGALAYTGSVTVITPGPRYIYPLLPVFLLLIAYVTQQLYACVGRTVPAGRHALWIIAVVLSVGWVSLNIASHTVKPENVWLHQLVRERFEEPTGNGESLQGWFDRSVPANAVLASSDGQLTGHYLHHPTLSFVPGQLSDIRWTEDQVRKTMAFYKATYLIVYRDSRGKELPEIEESPFLAGLVEGRSPDWLELRASNSKVLVYGTVSSETKKSPAL
jgi:hypothetical protein